MELNLQKLFAQPGTPLTEEGVFDFSGRDFGHFTAAAPVQFQYRAEGKNGEVQLFLSLQTTLQANCARCLAPFGRPWQLQRNFCITRADLEEEFPELPYTPGGGLDMEELAYGELLLDVDPVLLCREDCPGLCPTCGKPPAECACAKNGEGDPRLAVLAQLLNDN